jgi:hypothetical protein
VSMATIPPTGFLPTLYPWTRSSSGRRSDPVTVICEGPQATRAQTILAMHLPTAFDSDAGCSGNQSVTIGARTIPHQQFDFATQRVSQSLARTHTRIFVLTPSLAAARVLLAPVHRDHVRAGCFLSESGSFFPGGMVLEVAMTFTKTRDMMGEAFTEARLNVDRLATGNRGSVRQCDGRRTVADGIILRVQ